MGIRRREFDAGSFPKVVERMNLNLNEECLLQFLQSNLPLSSQIEKADESVRADHYASPPAKRLPAAKPVEG